MSEVNSELKKTKEAYIETSFQTTEFIGKALIHLIAVRVS